MARTFHHSHQRRNKWGLDYGSRRAGMAGQSVCRMNKKLTRRVERCVGKSEVRGEFTNAERSLVFNYECKND